MNYCDRCGKKAEKPNIINPNNQTSGFSSKRTVLCDKCRTLWHIAFEIINKGSYTVRDADATKKAWEKFMIDERERVMFT